MIMSSHRFLFLVLVCAIAMVSAKNWKVGDRCHEKPKDCGKKNFCHCSCDEYACGCYAIGDDADNRHTKFIDCVTGKPTKSFAHKASFGDLLDEAKTDLYSDMYDDDAYDEAQL
eukprot:CAMPEP_0202692868 /NCGR_PEP_ID=MMETSP1385-20130828/7142_1 /ASSEMBLY_ACC=CAM_ASM_000861 /TAXON_ID=933848 /ORGANISM="Elphidium margaritaceum" /LENGTH=113 /DNA_ID=CAMNT_0049348469 /DNA_START=28 /DNA_END=365 /DNA_ORIENTATION=+